MPNPDGTNPAGNADSGAAGSLIPSGQHEVTLPMDLSLPDNVNVHLPPLITRIALPVAYFAEAVKAK